VFAKYAEVPVELVKALDQLTGGQRLWIFGKNNSSVPAADRHWDSLMHRVHER